MKKFKQYLKINEEVRHALEQKKPVVALESTIISHGLPYPENLNTATEMERLIREKGAVPATIGVIEGQLKVGLTKEELYFFATDKSIIKASRRDLPYLTSQKLHGATTVASTMIIAEMAEIKVFATGGIGGVHRGAERSFDISADLQELAKTSVAVVCAGAKSILDIGLTLEYLETHGVPVIGFNTSEFPAFHTRESGYNVNFSAQTPKEISRLMRDKWLMNLIGGIVVANPIPAKSAMDPKVMNEGIHNAIKKAEVEGVTGKELTPFLLAELKELTHGKSLKANIDLVYNNGKLGAEIAVEFAKLRESEDHE